ncbi:CHAP domain-containing protein [Pseudomonas sp. GCM10022188]|uniref:CHAP domain-containing protein n=1 Tax=Pseudomonas TaxID=286 RepID=UPI001E33E1B9|nr:CHAP domain-containing protein [Pseudomonas oryzagri]MCC6076711.1 CHAP domain-containing protein [Pseudomonas oryzagri]
MEAPLSHAGVSAARRRHLKPYQWALALTAPVLLVLAIHAAATHLNPNLEHTVGEQIDDLNGVAIYFNGGVNTTNGRNLSQDGYNLGLRYQCVEFVKRYYFERYDHRMPDTYGHARDFFDLSLPDGGINVRRGMLQFSNGSSTRPEADDLVVFRPWLFNRYGHVAIVASVDAASLQIAQQNPGPFGQSRESFPVASRDGKWFIEHSRVLGWLRLEDPPEDVTATR